MKAIFLILIFSMPAFADQYASFEELAKNETLGVDYSIVVKDQNSPVSLLAVHGGKIEPGTSELIHEMDDRFNHYHFIGQKPLNNFSLHITSSLFNEPEALTLAKKSKRCVAFHGYIGKGENAACIGGGNTRLAETISNTLKESNLGFDVVYPCARYPGLHPENIVNRCEEQGVQIEMSGELRGRILSDQDFRKKFATVLSNIL
jgi:phage replication-related protein YjqB (UPF0714/DUF867 family)